MIHCSLRPQRACGSRSASRTGRLAGFALADALLGVLLLCFALLAAGTAMLRALQATRSAVVQLRATELAADLGEGLAASSDPGVRGALLASWPDQVVALLPEGARAAATPVELAGPAGTALPAVTASFRWPLSTGAPPDLDLLLADPARAAP